MLGSGSIPVPGSRRRAARRGRAAAAIAALLCLAPATTPAEPPGGARLRLTVAYSVKSFVDVDTEDARTAARIWSERMIQSKLPGSEIRTQLFESLSELESSIRSGAVDVIGLASKEFLDLATRVRLEPTFVTDSDDGPYTQILLLVRKDLDARNISDLKGKRLNLVRSGDETWQRMWLDSMLMKEDLPAVDRFFSSIRLVRQPSQAILPVFFGQADACVVTREAYRVAVELNPQVDRTVTALQTSPSILTSVVAFRPGLDPGTHATLLRVLTSLDSEPVGRQILTLFRQRRLVPFRPEYLESMRALVAEHRTLTERRATQRVRAR